MNAPDPHDAFDAFVEGRRDLALKYEEFWIEKFKQAGIPLAPNPQNTAYRHPYVGLSGVYAGYDLTVWTDAESFEGAKVKVHCDASSPVSAPRGYAHWHEVKIKSDSGFKKLLRGLERREFV